MAARYCAVVLLLLLTACAAATDVYDKSGAGYLKDTPAVLAGIDWTTAQSESVTLSDFAFTPKRLAFRRGTPYRLKIENRGSRDHTFTSEDFFKAVAVDRLDSPEAVVKQPYLKTIAVAPGTSKELYFVAVKAGDYPLECSMPLHATFGMTGTIAIE